MKILMFGGFLGSGKTTMIRSLIQGLMQEGSKVAIIENEIGEVGIDQDILGDAGLRITTLTGGCICCQITGDLISSSKKIKEEVAPDWLIIETTGLAVLKSIADSFGRYGDPDTPVYSFAVVDISRWDVLIRAMENLLKSQMEGVNGVLLNKTDVKTPTEAVLEQIAQFSGNAPAFQVSLNSNPQEILAMIRSALTPNNAKEEK